MSRNQNFQKNFPDLPPRIIEDFISWLTQNGYKIHAIKTASKKFQLTMFNSFWIQYDKKQLTIHDLINANE